MNIWFTRGNDRMSPWMRNVLHIEGNEEEWGAGDGQEENLPPAPTGIRAEPGNGSITVSWNPVPDALYYNLYFLSHERCGD